MAITITAPRFSFVQFTDTPLAESCNFNPIYLCLPVFAETDVAFQFILVADTEEEADELCDLQNDLVEVGLIGGSADCDDEFLLNFTQTFSLKPQRFRISPLQVLYNWEEYLPGFESVVDVGECFRIKIRVNAGEEENNFCSVCFQRIGASCHTSVLEYGNDENAFGFNYCNSSEEDIDGVEDCEPTIIQFTNETNLAIPYTASMQAKYGNMPSAQVWIYDENSELVNMGVTVTFDAYPPTEIRVDLGGPASGILKIM